MEQRFQYILRENQHTDISLINMEKQKELLRNRMVGFKNTLSKQTRVWE